MNIYNRRCQTVTCSVIILQQFGLILLFLTDHVLQIHFICKMVFTKPDQIQMRNCVTLVCALKVETSKCHRKQKYPDQHSAQLW